MPVYPCITCNFYNRRGGLVEIMCVRVEKIYGKNKKFNLTLHVIIVCNQSGLAIRPNGSNPLNRKDLEDLTFAEIESRIGNGSHSSAQFQQTVNTCNTLRIGVVLCL